MENRMNDNDEIEIDLLELFLELKKRLWIILLAVVLGAGAAGAFSYFTLTPQYTSTAMMYVLSKETTLTSLADLQIGSQLTKDYTVVVTSRPVLEEVIETLGLDMSYRSLRGKIEIKNPTDTRILSISVTDADPHLAKTLVDQLANTSSSYIGDIMEMVPPKVIEDGEVSAVPVSPNNKKNAMLGGLAGAFLVCAVIVLGTILNDTVRTEEDINHYLGVSVLASVPKREQAGSEHGKKRKKGKKA